MEISEGFENLMMIFVGGLVIALALTALDRLLNLSWRESNLRSKNFFKK